MKTLIIKKLSNNIHVSVDILWIQGSKPDDKVLTYHYYWRNCNESRCKHIGEYAPKAFQVMLAEMLKQADGTFVGWIND